MARADVRAIRELASAMQQRQQAEATLASRHDWYALTDGVMQASYEAYVAAVVRERAALESCRESTRQENN
jgi:hypothetical protein